jgi:ABC-type sugar transport system ATPase subunit
MAGVTLKGVSKSFGKTQVIENLDLDIQIRSSWSWWGLRDAVSPRPSA